MDFGSDCVLGFLQDEVVLSLVDSGGYAEFCVADERLLIRASVFLPRELGMPALTAIPLSFMTAYLVRCGRTRRYEYGLCVFFVLFYFVSLVWWKWKW
jgi:NADPH:quinone reductase-like Zn-dependent oxidoreductase